VSASGGGELTGLVGVVAAMCCVEGLPTVCTYDVTSLIDRRLNAITYLSLLTFCPLL